MDVHLLVGPHAGRGTGGQAITVVRRTLVELGAIVHDLTGPDAQASADAACAAVASGAQRLVVVGGDGLVHLGLQAVAGTETVLGIVPLGTGNDFTRGIPALPTDPAEAARAALGPAVLLVAIEMEQASSACHRWVASVATAGFSGDVNARANRLRFPKGPLRYTVATMLELPRMRNRPLTLTIDGVDHLHSTSLVAFGNTGWFGGGMHICPDADPTDGLIEVTVVAGAGRVELLRFFRLVFSGRHLEHPKVHVHRGHEIRIDGAGILVWGDGEPLMTAAPGDPIVLRAVPAAFRLASPAASDPESDVAG